MRLSVCVLACVSVCVAFDYLYSFDADLTSKYDDEIFDKKNNEDTMEFMDELKEELDASITPLSDMTFSSADAIPFTLCCDKNSVSRASTVDMANSFFKSWLYLSELLITFMGVGSETIEMNYIEDNVIEDVIVTPCYIDMGYIDLEKYGAEDSSRTTEMDPHDYIHRKRTSSTAVVPDQRPRGRQKGKIGRPKKTTLFPMVTPAARVLKKRIKWDDTMNKFVMYTYYYVTKIETDKEQWRPKLRQKFLEVYPDFHTVTDQRLADQKRIIIHNLLLDRKVLVEIKRAVRKQLEMEGVTVNPAKEPKDKSFYN